MQTHFTHLFTPLRVRGIMFPNRIFLSPQGHSPKHRHPSSYDSLYDAGMLFFDKSQGGFGGCTIATGPVLEDGHYEKYARDQIRELMSMATQTGARVAAGVMPFTFHPDKIPPITDLEPQYAEIEGGTPKGQPSSGNQPMMPNYRASDGLWDGYPCEEMPKSMILESIETARRSAKAAREFGFDYVEVGGFAHGSAIASFLSAKENHRTDEFGGSLENRCRYPLMLLQAVREAIGEDMPMAITISSQLYDQRSADLSHTEDEMIEFLKRAQGILDMVIISSGMDTTNLWNENVFHCGTIFQKKDFTVEFSKRMKKETPQLIAIPRGGINTVQLAEEVIAENWGDAVCVGRSFVADPYWPKKAMEGREEDIVPCLRCDYCYHSATDHMNLFCSVNPRLFRERRVPAAIEPASVRKKVVVIGGGPAGCKAALTAAERGHEVILIEKSDAVGGQLKHAPYDHHKEDLDNYKKYLQVQIAKSKAQVIYNTTATPEWVRSMNPDALVIAVGAEPVCPPIPGIEKAQEATSFYTRMDEIGQRVAIIGGGTIGAELALTLAETGRDVTVIEMNDELAAQGHFFYKIGLKHAILDVKENYHALLKTRCLEVLDNGVRVMDAEGQEQIVEADTVIYAVGMKSKREEALAFYGITPQTAVIVDCKRVGRVMEATHDGYFFAMSL